MNVKKMKIIFAIVLGIVLLSDFLVHRHPPTFIWDKIPGFSAVYGLISCILIVVVSKFIGYHGLMKKEDYYD
jgi:hypothetical protein